MKYSSGLDDDQRSVGIKLLKYTSKSSSGKVVEVDMEDAIHLAFERCDSEGIALLYRHYYRPLCSHAVRFVTSKEVAEDIVSDIFCRFHAEAMYKKIDISFRAYLYKSVRNRAFDYVKLEARNNMNLSIAEVMPIQDYQQPDQVTQFEDLREDVDRAINSLPSMRRRVYIMHRFEGKKHQEIADELSLSLRTVEAHMYQATTKVRELIRLRWIVSFLLISHVVLSKFL